MADRKRKSKGFYKKMAKLAKYDSKDYVALNGGLRGFLVTCNFNEYNCLKESYSILQEIAEKLYGEEFVPVSSNAPQEDVNKNDDKKNDDADENIESSIQAELESLKSKKERRFIQVKTKCPNVIFVKTNDPNVIPSRVMQQLFDDIRANSAVNSRYIQRILPVDITFKANKEVFFERFTELFDELATKEPKKFSVMVKVRFNNDHPSESALKESCIKIIKEKRTNWTVRHDNPEILIFVNICIKAACLSLIENYDDFSKYNPGEFLKKLTNKTPKTEADNPEAV